MSQEWGRGWVWKMLVAQIQFFLCPPCQIFERGVPYEILELAEGDENSWHEMKNFSLTHLLLWSFVLVINWQQLLLWRGQSPLTRQIKNPQTSPKCRLKLQSQKWTLWVCFHTTCASALEQNKDMYRCTPPRRKKFMSRQFHVAIYVRLAEKMSWFVFPW